MTTICKREFVMLFYSIGDSIRDSICDGICDSNFRPESHDLCMHIHRSTLVYIYICIRKDSLHIAIAFVIAFVTEIVIAFVIQTLDQIYFTIGSILASEPLV